jgi:hypothetical protein
MEEVPDLVGTLFCVALCLFPLVLFGVSFYIFKRRISNLATQAGEMGFSFAERGTEEQLESLAHFRLFTQGTSRKIRNLMRGEREGIGVWLFDYRYKPPVSGSRRVWAQTVILAETDPLQLPAFYVRPRNLLDHLGAEAEQEIEFTGEDRFSKRYVVLGEDEAEVRQLLTPDVRAFFADHQGLSVEGSGQQLVIYRMRDQKTAGQIEGFLQEGLQLVRLVKGSHQESLRKGG